MRTGIPGGGALLRAILLVMVNAGLATPAPSDTGGPSVAEPAAAIIWQDHDTGKASAAQSGRPLLIHFTAGWCHWCRVMQRDTYAHPEVMVLLRDAFVTARVDADRQPRVQAEYGVPGLPTVWFLESDGAPITYVPGYVDGPTFLLILRWIESGAYRHQAFNDFQATGS